MYLIHSRSCAKPQPCSFVRQLVLCAPSCSICSAPPSTTSPQVRDVRACPHSLPARAGRSQPTHRPRWPTWERWGRRGPCGTSHPTNHNPGRLIPSSAWMYPPPDGLREEASVSCKRTGSLNDRSTSNFEQTRVLG